MKKFLKAQSVVLIITLMSMIALVALSHTTVLNYSLKMEEQYDQAANDGLIAELETAIGYGKSLDNYYGLSSLLKRNAAVLREGSILLVLDQEGKPISSSQEGDVLEIDTRLYGELRQDITLQDESVAGTCVTFYPLTPIQEDVRADLPKTALCSAGLFLLIAAVSFFAFSRLNWDTRRMVRIVLLGVLVQGICLGVFYMPRFQQSAEHSVQGVAHYLQGTLSSMSEKGIDLKDISDLDEILQETTDKYEWIRDISFSADAATGKNQQSFPVSGSEDNLMMTIEVSSAYLRQQVINMMLSYLAVIFLAVIIMIEALPLSEISQFLTSPYFGKRCSEQFAALAKSLRYVSFLSNTFTYLCLSFSALLIKDWNQDFFGMPAGIAAALSISLCTLADAGGMLCMPLISLPMNTLILGTSALLIVSNFACFFTHSVGVILLMRFLSGLSCAGHKQIMNTIIAQGYDTGEERTANLAANNYGIIGGILCGLGMGSVIADAFGYAATFLAAGFGGILYLLSVWYLLPWRMFDPRKEGGEGAVERIRSVLKMLFDPNLWRTIVMVVAPQYLLLMVIIVFIPGRVQSAGMPGVVLTYANLLNGVFGLYLGGYVSAFLNKRLSMVKSMSLMFCVCAVSLLLMDLPVFPVAMVLLGAVVMGLADGVGTPLATELFLGNRTVMMELDEAEGLMLYGIFGNIIMTVAPVLLEMCERSFTWTLCLSGFLVLASGLLMSSTQSRKEKKKA